MLREKQVQFSDTGKDYWYSRIFADPDTWLTVYYDRDRHPVRFTYVEGIRTDVKACLQGSNEGKLNFYRIDSGESSPLANRSPVATGTLSFDKNRFIASFRDKAREIDPDIREWIIQCVTGSLE